MMMMNQQKLQCYTVFWDTMMLLYSLHCMMVVLNRRIYKKRNKAKNGYTGGRLLVLNSKICTVKTYGKLFRKRQYRRIDVFFKIVGYSFRKMTDVTVHDVLLKDLHRYLVRILRRITLLS